MSEGMPQAAAIKLATQEALAAKSDDVLGRGAIVEHSESYRRFIRVVATEEDWIRAAAALGVAQDTAIAEKVAKWYREEFDRIALAFGRWAAERQVMTALASLQSHVQSGEGEAEANCRETLQACVRKLGSSALPAADAAIEQAFARLTTSAPNASPELIARVRRTLFLAARQRSLAGSSDLGLQPLVPFPEIVANAPAEACLTAGPNCPPGTDQRASAVAQIVLDWETQVEAHVVHAIRLNETAMLRVFASEGKAQQVTIDERKQSLRMHADLPMRRVTDDAIDRIAAVLSESADLSASARIDARAAWEDFAWSSTLNVFPSTEQPTVAWEWIRRHSVQREFTPEIVERCHDIYRAYLTERTPLRVAMRAALLSGELKDLARQYHDSAAAGALNAAFKLQQNLSESSVQSMIDALPESERPALKRHLELVKKQRGAPYGHFDEV